MSTDPKETQTFFKDMEDPSKKAAYDFMEIYDTASNPEKRASNKKQYMFSTMNLDLFISAYCIKCNGIEKFLTDKRTNGRVTPISLLASNGEHQAVEFLLECSSNLDYALVGYDVGGHLTSIESVSKLLASFSDHSLQKDLAEKIQEVVPFDVISLLPESPKCN